MKNALASLATFALLIGLIAISIDFGNFYGSVDSRPKSVAKIKPSSITYTPEEIKEARKWYKWDIDMHKRSCLMEVLGDVIDQGYVVRSVRTEWRKDEDLGCEVLWYDHPGGWGWRETNYLLYKPSFEEYCALYHQVNWPEVRERLFDSINEEY